MGIDQLREIAASADLRTACRIAHAELWRDGVRKAVVYRLTPGGLDRVVGFDSRGTWTAPPATLAPVPDAVEAFVRDVTTAADPVSLPDIPALDGLWVLPLLAAGKACGALFMDAPPGEHAHAVTPLLGARVRIALDDGELQRLRVERYDQLVRAETLAATGMLSAGVAHELNNPLGVVLGLAELLCVDPTLSEEARADARVIAENTGRAVKVVQQLLSYGRGGDLAHEVVELTEILESCVSIFQAKIGEGDIEVRRRFMGGHVKVVADGYLLQQALLAIMDNARQAIRDLGRPGTIDVELAPDEAEGRVCISIQDDGPGIAPAVMPRIFDPFFTTREVGKGTGMGLALVHRTVRNTGGDIRCESEPGQGARFVIVLDRCAEAA